MVCNGGNASFVDEAPSRPAKDPDMVTKVDKLAVKEPVTSNTPFKTSLLPWAKGKLAREDALKA